MKRIGNLTPRFGARAGTIAPCLVAVLALVGVSMPAVHDLRERELLVDALRAHVEGLRAEHDDLQRWAAAGGFDALEDDLQAARAALPDLSAVAAFTAVRRAAAELGIEIESLRAVAEVDLGGGAGAYELDLVARTSRAALTSLPASLRAAGCPSAVLAGSIEPSERDHGELRLRQRLVIFGTRGPVESAAQPPAPGDAQGGSPGGLVR